MTEYAGPVDATLNGEIDAHWYAAEGLAAAVVHAMLVQPARADVAAANEQGDWERGVASAVVCLRWIAACREMLAGRSAGRTGIQVDLLVAAGRPASPIDAVANLAVHPDATEDEARRALALVDAADRTLIAELPLEVTVRRTPTGYQPVANVVSELERLRHRLGLPSFDWEAWIR